MAYLPNPTEREAWLERHALTLDELAHHADVTIELVHMTADLVLTGLVDDEIYDHLRAHVLSSDGQRNPLGGAPQVVREIRRLVASTTEENNSQ